MKEDKLRGFQIGGDDYITKPFSTEELRMRINAILRRIHRGDPKSNVFIIGQYKFDYANHILALEKEERQLTKREAELLRMLCINMNNVLRRDMALKTIWGEDD
jgi:DNA-binding response OmpR family regulator